MTNANLDRRKVLRTIVALGVSGPCLISEAQANPLLWFLRTVAYNKLARKAARILTRQSSRGQSTTRTKAAISAAEENAATATTATRFGIRVSDLVQSTIKPELRDKANASIEIWDACAPQALFLHIPIVSETLSGQLEIYMNNLETGKSRLVASSPLTVTPNHEGNSPQVFLRPLRERGLFQFTAVLPSLVDSVRIQDTQPVLIQ